MANPASDFEYTESDGEVTITGLKNREMEGALTIPREIGGHPVICIGNSELDGDEDGEICGAFENCEGLTSVSIPDSVTSIGERAFYHCRKLTSIIAPNGVPNVGKNAFSGTAYQRRRKILRASGTFLFVILCMILFAAIGAIVSAVMDSGDWTLIAAMLTGVYTGAIVGAILGTTDSKMSGMLGTVLGAALFAVLSAIIGKHYRDEATIIVAFFGAIPGAILGTADSKKNAILGMIVGAILGMSLLVILFVILEKQIRWESVLFVAFSGAIPGAILWTANSKENAILGMIIGAILGSSLFVINLITTGETIVWVPILFGAFWGAILGAITASDRRGNKIPKMTRS